MKKQLVKITTSLFAVTLALMIFSSCQKDNLTPSTETSFEETMKSNKPGEFSIAEIAIAEGFDSLVVALSYVDAELNTGLVDLFWYGTDQYTVFAPTNEAFAALLGNDTNAKIADLPAPLVLDVLFYHVTEGRRASNSVVPKKNLKNIETLLGVSFSVNADPKIIAVGNEANFVAVDISASNGVIHVIDAVILPIE
jgi:transforming growth factor-beta-induced protein